MPKSVRLHPVYFALAFLSLSAVSASAFCGLQSCPRPAGSFEVPTVEAALRTRGVSYDIADNHGHYVVTAPRVFVNHAGFAVGAEVPLTRLDNGGSVSTGLSNPVVMGRYARRLSYAWSGEVGLQWELPLGNQADGLAGDHHMLLPWVGLRFDASPSWYLSGMFGVSTALGHSGAGETSWGSGQLASDATLLPKPAHAGHDHDATPVLVNPHADREAQWRASAGWVRGRGTLEGFGLGQTDMTDAGPETFVRAGVSYEWMLVRFTSLQVIGDIPVTSPRRNETEVGLTVKTGF